MDGVLNGSIKFYNQRGRYGIIRLEDGREAHFSDRVLEIMSGELESGRPVTCEVRETGKNPPLEATRVWL